MKNITVVAIVSMGTLGFNLAILLPTAVTALDGHAAPDELILAINDCAITVKLPPMDRPTNNPPQVEISSINNFDGEVMIPLTLTVLTEQPGGAMSRMGPMPTVHWSYESSFLCSPERNILKLSPDKPVPKGTSFFFTLSTGARGARENKKASPTVSSRIYYVSAKSTVISQSSRNALSTTSGLLPL